MGLILGTLLPLCVGFPCILMSPASFAQRPIRWLRAISRFGGTASFGSNFAYDICVDTISAVQRETLDLGRWSIAINGSEPVRAHTLERFAEAYRSRGFRKDAFRPGYGLAEATLAVSCGHRPDRPPVRTLRMSSAALEKGRIVEAADESVPGKVLVGCGLINADDTVVIVDPTRNLPCAPDQVGEIWVAGGSIAQGYWDRPDESAETFGARLADTGRGPFLRTGDLGFLRDGELFITGRVKDLIIVRGRNLYPHDIELTVEASHPGVRRGAGAAFSVDIGDEERLVIVQEIQHGQNINAEAIAVAARRAVVNEYEVQPHAVVLVKPGSIHKTTSGKIQRYACREAYLKGALAVYEP
jgi:acyl-CoA synthetase (AMP-forming)/AMP-acid ligase II